MAQNHRLSTSLKLEHTPLVPTGGYFILSPFGTRLKELLHNRNDQYDPPPCGLDSLSYEETLVNSVYLDVYLRALSPEEQNKFLKKQKTPSIDSHLALDDEFHLFRPLPAPAIPRGIKYE